MSKKIFCMFLALLLLFSEYNLLSRILDKNFFKVIYSADYKEGGVPVFTLGYLEYTKDFLIQEIDKSKYKCRSLRLNVSYSGNKVYQEVEMYCNESSINSKQKRDKLAQIIGDKIKENTSIQNVSIDLTEISSPPKETKGPILVLSFLFLLLVFLSIPWSWLFRR